MTIEKPKDDEQPKADEEPKAGEQPDGGAKGGPDWQAAAEKYKAQRDLARKATEDLQSKYDELTKATEGLKGAEDVQRAVDEAVAKANEGFEAYKADASKRERRYAIDAALTKAGCIDVAAALSHVDPEAVKVGEGGEVEGLDVEAMRKQYPYLFGQRAKAGSTDAPAAGAASGGIEGRIDAAMGIDRK